MNIFKSIVNFSKKAFDSARAVAKKPFAYGAKTSGSYDLSNYKIGAGTFFAVYSNNGDVYSVVREYQQNVLAKGYEWVNVENPDEEPDEAFIDRAEAVFNYTMPFRKLKERMIRDFFVPGNNYVSLLESKNESKTRSERILGLQPIDPRTMAIVADDRGNIVKYKQKSYNKAEVIDFEPEEIAHWKNGTDPNHEIFGMSPLEPILWEARTDIQAMVRNYFFFENNAQPDAYFIMDDSVQGEDEIKKAMDDINDQFKGSTKAHKSTILKGIKDIKTLNITQKDMEFIGGRRFTTEKVCSAYGVPKVVLNYTDGVNYSTAEIQYQKFIENSVTPVDEDIVEFFNREILTRISLNGVLLSDKIAMKPREQSLESQSEVERRAMLELNAGVLTRRQYKKKTGQELQPEDESEPMFDKHIIQGGVSSVLLEDVGVDPFVDPNDPEQAQKFLDQLEGFKKKLNEKS